MRKRNMTIRLSDKLDAAIRKSAEENGRSIGGEIAFRLAAQYRLQEQLGHIYRKLEEPALIGSNV